MHTILHLAAITATVLLLARFLPSVKIKSIGSAIVVAIVFSLLNFFLGWLIKAVLFVPALFTFGLLFLFIPFIINTRPAVVDRQAHRVVPDRHDGRTAGVVRRHHAGQRRLPARAEQPPAGASRRRSDALDLTRKACNLSRMRNPSHPLGRFSVLAVAACLALGLPACKKKGKGKATGGGDPSQVVAKVDDAVITVGDVQERINKQSPFVRARYTTNEKKKEFLDSLIRFEVMANEAERRGYDKDPEVLRVMKQQMISKFLQKDFESKLKVEDVPDADVEKYYKEHPAEFNQKDEVRVSEMVVKEKGKADKAYAEAQARCPRAGRPPPGGPSSSRTWSRNTARTTRTKQRGGDLGFFDKESTRYPKPVVEAAFKLAEVGDVAAPIKTDKGFAVIRLTQKRPGSTGRWPRSSARSSSACSATRARRRWTTSSPS